MLLSRIIPCLLMHDGGFVKTKKFKNPDYLGDPNQKRSPDFNAIQDLANECWVPLAYGGGVNNIDDIKRLFSMGIEKIILNSAAFSNPDLVKQAVNSYGSQAIVASVDIGRDIFGRYNAYTQSGKKKIKMPYMDYLLNLQELGFGEVFLNFIDLDGTWQGYNVQMASNIIQSLKIPVIVCGGAGQRSDFIAMLSGGATAVAAGSLFVYKGKDKGVLINYPERDEVDSILEKAKLR